MERHELSRLAGDIRVDEFNDLVESIRKDGLTDPVLVTYEGKILDGWHRYQAAQRAGVEPEFREYRGDKPWSFVIARCTRRNHTEAQRVAFFTGAREWSRGRPRKDANLAVLPETAQEIADETVGGPIKSAQWAELPTTAREIADETGVSVRTVERIRAAENAGLGDQIRSGELTPRAAEKIIKKNESPETSATPAQSIHEKKIEKLQSRVIEQAGTIDEMHEANLELIDMLKSYDDAGEAKTKQANVIASLRNEIRALKSQLNEKIHIANEFKKEANALRRAMGRK